MKLLTVETQLSGIRPESCCRAEVARLVEPRAAAMNPMTAISRFPRPAVYRSSVIRIVPTILDPFLGIADGIVEAKGIGLVTADASRSPAIAIGAGIVPPFVWEFGV